MALDSAKLESLTLSGGGKTYAIAELSCSWALGQVPSAQCRIMTGKELIEGTYFGTAKWEPPDPKTKWTITAVVSGLGLSESVKLLTGYIVAFSETGQSSSGGSGVGVQISLSAEAVQLLSVASSTYIYWDMKGESTKFAWDIDRTQINSDIQAMLNNPASVLETDDAKAKIKEVTGMDDFNISTSLQKYLLGAAAYYHSRVSYNIDKLNPLDYFDVSRDIKVSSIVPVDAPDSAKYAEAMAEAYFHRFNGGNLWSALQGTAEMFYLSLVPRREKIEIVPVLGWLKKPQLTISRSLLLGVQGSVDQAALLYSPDQVIVVGNLPAGNNALAATDKSAGIALGFYPYTKAEDVPPQGRSVTVTLPDWLAKHLRIEMGATPLPADNGAAEPDKQDKRVEYQKTAAETRAASNKSDEQRTTVIQEFAKMYFARYKNAGQGVNLRIPWNSFELIDSLGYVVEIPDPSLYTARPEHTLYGVIQGVSLTISKNSTGGAASMTLSVGQVRDKAANEQYGLDTHPFYQFDYAKGANQISVGAGITKSSELNLDSRLGPSV